MRTQPDPIEPAVQSDAHAPVAPFNLPHGHQASLETGLAFVNTLDYARGLPVERLESPAVALRWLPTNTHCSTARR